MLVREGEKVWETRSQVERTYRKSPIFRAEMKYAQFNPTWTVFPPASSAQGVSVSNTQWSSLGWC